MPHNSINNWIRAYKTGKLGEIGNGQRPLTETEMENARLRRELAQARMECDILKKSRRVLCEGVAEKYAMIEMLRLEYPVPVLCLVLEVSVSGYYAKRSRIESKRACDYRRLEAEIKAAHKRRNVWG